MGQEQSHQGVAEQLQAMLNGARDIARLVVCASIEGLTSEEMNEGKRACREAYLEGVHGEVTYVRELADEIRDELVRKDVLLVYGRCRTHGPSAVYNAIPPR